MNKAEFKEWLTKVREINRQIRDTESHPSTIRADTGGRAWMADQAIIKLDELDDFQVPPIHLTQHQKARLAKILTASQLQVVVGILQATIAPEQPGSYTAAEVKSICLKFASWHSFSSTKNYECSFDQFWVSDMPGGGQLFQKAPAVPPCVIGGEIPTPKEYFKGTTFVATFCTDSGIKHGFTVFNKHGYSDPDAFVQFIKDKGAQFRQEYGIDGALFFTTVIPSGA